MLNFNYFNPTKIIFGKDRLNEITNEIPKNSKILMVFGESSILRSGLYDEIKKILGEFRIYDFGGVSANPTYEYLNEAKKIIVENEINFILAVGGGSVIDGAKYISVLPFINNEWDKLTTAFSFLQNIPLGVVLTLPATGSEMNGSFVITNKSKNDKRVFVIPPVFPKFSYLNPKVIESLPKKQIANGIIDAFVHVLEQYLTKPSNSMLQDGFSETILRTLMQVGHKVYENPKDYNVAANFLWCTTMALNGLIGAGVMQDWATHMIGHELTALYNIDHARSLAIVLPSLLNSQMEVKKEKLHQYAVNVLNLSGDNIEGLAIRKTEEFFNSLDVETKLSQYNVFDADKIIPEKMEENRLLPIGELQQISKNDVKEILINCQ